METADWDVWRHVSWTLWATLGLPGDGIGLNYHFGLFRQMFVDHKQKEVKNPWITSESWLVKQPVSFQVPFKNFTMHSVLYDIDVPGYESGCNRLHLFDVGYCGREYRSPGQHSF